MIQGNTYLWHFISKLCFFFNLLDMSILKEKVCILINGVVVNVMAPNAIQEIGFCNFQVAGYENVNRKSVHSDGQCWVNVTPQNDVMK